jgi:hypothetical protein
MLIIRQAQLAALERAMSGTFERCMVKHLLALHGSRFATLSEIELLDFVRSVIAKARACGIEGNEGFCTFLELTLEFGSEFPSGFEWAERVLAARSEQSRELRAEVLLQAAMRYLDAREAQDAEEIERAKAAEYSPPDLVGMDAEHDQ